ncbi:NAD(P)-binding protein [Xylariaceae sp. FL1272]|nr:NAD(P)-binding protein [Xylariaceae sp. FL1272]
MNKVTPDRVVVVTGAAGSLGSSIAAEIASLPNLSSTCHGIYAVRNLSQAPAVTHAVRLQKHGRNHSHELMQLDLEHLDSVRAFAANINERVAKRNIPKIRALVLNAGYLELQEQTWTDGGLDTTWTVNYLSQWLLALLLVESMDPENGRIVVLGSHTHDPHDRFNKGIMGGQYEDEKWKTMLGNSIDPLAKGTWSSNDGSPQALSGLRRYGASKLCVAMMIGELQDRLNRDPILSKVSILGVDPGWMATQISRRHPMYAFVRVVMPWVAGMLSWMQPNGMYRTPSRSARDVVAAAFGTGPMENEDPKGSYFKGTSRTTVSAEAGDLVKRKMVWAGSIEYAELQEADTVLVHWHL